MINAIKLIVSFLLLTVGGLSSYGLSQLHVRLFLHFLGGSGTTLTEDFFSRKELTEIKTLCVEKEVHWPAKEGSNWYVVSTYQLLNSGSPYPLALGQFSCSTNGKKVYDFYDFTYQDRDVGGNPLVCFKERSPKVLGSCLAEKGLGESFEIDITF
jgi:hypothetical protein